MHTAPVEIREKLAIAEAHWPEAIAHLCAFPHVEEAAVLSTCNRMEIYCVVLSYNRGVREVEEFLSKVRAPTPNLPPLHLAQRLVGAGLDAQRHAALLPPGWAVCCRAWVATWRASHGFPLLARASGVVTSPDPPRPGPATPG